MVPQNQLAALNRSTSVPMPANLEDFDKNPESYPASGRQLDVALVTRTGVSKGAGFISRSSRSPGQLRGYRNALVSFDSVYSSIFVPRTERNFDIQAGCAGHAGAVIRLASTTA